ncbi:hypothetical protein SLEP1_g6907 [Rubroshorea leprosula]|uniref:Uncharacterized protein n=1 Tax=Rubroshorea leprosula TaxID=152421 RepID=A0AAV5I5X2_9ROSI|nr:hypothetical protein SLEP1_g6907 [Rubroshorea leprosula]
MSIPVPHRDKGGDGGQNLPFIKNPCGDRNEEGLLNPTRPYCHPYLQAFSHHPPSTYLPMTVTPQNPISGTWQTPCTRERVPQMHKARNLFKSQNLKNKINLTKG